MKVSVYDTYVARKDGRTMHFDILVPDSVADLDTILAFGRAYLQSKGEDGQPITATECSFCHIEDASPEVEGEVAARGYAIVEMENC